MKSNPTVPGVPRRSTYLHWTESTESTMETSPVTYELPFLSQDPYGPLAWSTALTILALGKLIENPSTALEAPERSAIGAVSNHLRDLEAVVERPFDVMTASDPRAPLQAALFTMAAVHESAPDLALLGPTGLAGLADTLESVLRAPASANAATLKDAQNTCDRFFACIHAHRPRFVET